jgi:hypothetical protein
MAIRVGARVLDLVETCRNPVAELVEAVETKTARAARR